jgi:hypothetical protein
MVRALKPEELATWCEFCRDIPARIQNHDDLPARFILSEEATFHANGKVNRYMSILWKEKILMSLSSTKEIHHKWKSSVPFQKIGFMAPSFSQTTV